MSLEFSLLSHAIKLLAPSKDGHGVGISGTTPNGKVEDLLITYSIFLMT